MFVRVFNKYQNVCHLAAILKRSCPWQSPPVCICVRVYVCICICTHMFVRVCNEYQNACHSGSNFQASLPLKNSICCNSRTCSLHVEKQIREIKTNQENKNKLAAILERPLLLMISTCRNRHTCWLNTVKQSLGCQCRAPVPLVMSSSSNPRTDSLHLGGTSHGCHCRAPLLLWSRYD